MHRREEDLFGVVGVCSFVVVVAGVYSSIGRTKTCQKGSTCLSIDAVSTNYNNVM